VNTEIIATPGGNYIYLLTYEDQAAVVDPGVVAPVFSALSGISAKLSTILVTHYHFDHTGGCAQLKEATGCRVVAPAGYRTPDVDVVVEDGDVIALGDARILVISAPGHTQSDVVYYSEDAGAIWTGDVLFSGGCGRLFGGSASEMWNSLKKLRRLPPETLVYCGHDYAVDNLRFAAHIQPGNADISAALAVAEKCAAEGKPTAPTTIEQERLVNPFMRADLPELKRSVGLAGESPEVTFAAIRRMKDSW